MSPKRKIFITVLCLLGSFTIAVAFGIIPLARGISQDAQKLQTQKRTLEIFRKEIQEIENFKAFSQEKRQDVESLELLFVSPETPIPFIEFLEQYAKPLGVDLTIIPGDPKKLAEDFWPSLEFRISLKAPYPATFAFLKAMENAPFALEIKNIAMETSSLTLNLKAYTK